MRRKLEEEELRSQFYHHFQRWQEETAVISDSWKIKENPNFIAMVQMGKKVVPFIVEELKKEPSHLNWVLSRIYGKRISEQPVTNDEACKLWVEHLKREKKA